MKHHYVFASLVLAFLVLSLVLSPLYSSSNAAILQTEPELLATIYTDKTYYIQGDLVTIYGTTTYTNGTPVEGVSISIEVRNPRSNPIFLSILYSEPDGTYTDNFRISSTEPNGQYTVYIIAYKTGFQTAKAHTYFWISAYVHDLCVLGSNASKTVVGQGYCANITVTVKNKGNFTETFAVTLYGDKNTTVLGDEVVIGNQTVTSLTNGTLTTLTFKWNTTSCEKGNYTISAYAHPVPDETDTSDNSFTDGWVIMTIPGDVDGDGDVDIYDVVKITGIYGSKCGDPQFNPNSDLDCNCKIEIYDVVKCTSHYGQKDP